MPSSFTSSFASAAAGNTASEGSNGRNTSSGDWSRARPNGATQTFRRSSTATSLSQQRDGNQITNSPQSSGGNVYVPPHLNANFQSYGRNGSSADTRYSKDQLLDLFRSQAKAGSFNNNVNDLLLDGWSPTPNGTNNSGWGRKDDHKESTGPEICWDHSGSVQPISLSEMTVEEKEAFATSVNSPLKPPIQNSNKDATPTSGGVNRRTSITQNPSNNSPSTRPGARRRDSGGDLLQSSQPVTSPTSNSRFSRDETIVSSPPPSLLRRKIDLKDSFAPSLDEKDKEASASPIGPLKRTSTNPLSAGLNGPSSPWSSGPQSAGFSPMGAFGTFGPGGQTPSLGDKKSGFGSTRGESRFRGLMNATSSEDMAAKVKEKASNPNLERLPETNEQSQSRWAGDLGSQAQGTTQKLYADEEDNSAGSAALGGDEGGPPFPQNARYRNPDRQDSYDDVGFSSLGLSSGMPPFHEQMQMRDFVNQQTPHRSQAMGQMNEPMSPTTTNPYQSPEGEKAVPEDIETDESGTHDPQYGTNYGHRNRGFPVHMEGPVADRSQTSSTGVGRGFPSLSSLGSLSGTGNGGPWSAAPGAIGTPSRAQPGNTSGFGDTGFGGIGELTSPQTAAGFGSFGQSAIGGSGSFGRGGKLSSLFPTNMHDQVRGDSSRQDHAFGDNGDSHAPGFGFRDGRGGPDDLFGSMDRDRGLQSLTSPIAMNNIGHTSSSQVPISAPSQTPFSSTPSTTSYFGRNQEQDSSANQMPAAQQRQMVMPDRMLWIYRDPSGNTQGPWSGLEMHDWYKAGFFSPELQVKKFEDSDYEPLAQLIRKIGNSREPFLVPQIGIPHGPPAALPSSSTTSAAVVPATTPSAAQPPFAGSFPSFGTTLSAEQQNALERRKQEEQYLMARQKEHLAQQQVLLKQMQHMQGGQLHHHSSAHSLQSQPSYGSITSPVGYQPSPAQGTLQSSAAMPGFFDTSSRGAPLGSGIDPLSSVREEDLPGFMERLGMGRGSQAPYGSEGQAHQQHVAAIMQERARQEREQQQFIQQRGDEDQRVPTERLEQYHQLRLQEEQKLKHQGPAPSHVERQTSEADLAARQQRQDVPDYHDQVQVAQNERGPPEPLSLSEQVQKAAAKQPTTQPQSPWAKLDSGFPQPFPPPQSQSPMPAPTPQRNRQSVADALTAESKSPSNADSVETPSAALAPWAKERDEASKGPSLKEIQAMEAKKAAQQEEAAAAARRAIAEQERLNQRSQPVAPAPGLPSSANWASSISPAIPTTTGVSPWAKPAAGKPAVATPVAGAKKTLAQIQKEEENKKNRQAASQATAAANLASAATPLAGGKRYADLASKPTPLASPSGNPGWTTVGASGKVKTPTTPAPGLTARSASGGMVQPSVNASKPKPNFSSAAKGPANQQHADEEFQKWTKTALSRGLNANIPVDSFVTELLLLPAEPEIIQDSIYANSQTLDGRRFAEEFVRRRKMADRGLVLESGSTPNFSSSSSATENKSSGGWSEVAKKGPPAMKDEGHAAFKVVGGKKKGAKR